MEKKNEAKTAPPVEKAELQRVEDMPPFFVEAEKMLDRFEDLSREIGPRADDFFISRGGDWGRELDDWFKAETELLRYVPVEITETEKMVKINADVAGYKPEEIELSVKDNMLMISGKTELANEKKNENLLYSEFRSDRFFRQLPLPPVDAEQATAELKNGILNIMLPKATVAEPVTKIAVAAAAR